MAHKMHIISERGQPSELRRKFGTSEDAEANMMEASNLHHAVMDVVAGVGAMTVNEMKVTEYKRYKKACYEGSQRFNAVRIRNMKKVKDWTRRRNPQIMKAITSKVVHMVETIKGLAKDDWSNVGDVLYYAHFCRRPVLLHEQAVRMRAATNGEAGVVGGSQDPLEDEDSQEEAEAAEIATSAIQALQAAPVQELSELSMHD